MDFNVGDRVQGKNNNIVFTGTVYSVDGNYQISVMRDDGHLGSGKDSMWAVSNYGTGWNYELQLINKKSIMEKISNAFKKFISADLQTQVKAGFRNGGLELTEAGKVAAIEALLDGSTDAQKAFVASAQQIIDEAEKKNS
jgi:hypothetical protein